MRGLTIAMVIIIFCFSIEMWNTIEMEHFNETNKTITGWNPNQNPPVRYVSLPNVGSSDTFESTLDEMSTPSEQPWWEQVIDTAWASLTTLFSFIVIIVDVLIKSTIAFFPFIQSFGRKDLVILPDYITMPLATLVYMLYIFMIGQLIINRNMRDGA